MLLTEGRSFGSFDLIENRFQGYILLDLLNLPVELCPDTHVPADLSHQRGKLCNFVLG
jgi:hypothetical protein